MDMIVPLRLLKSRPSKAGSSSVNDWPESVFPTTRSEMLKVAANLSRSYALTRVRKCSFPCVNRPVSK